MYRLGFIGCGNMGSAILKGVVEAKLMKPEEIVVSVRSKESANALKETYGVHACNDNKEAAKADILLLAIKPFMFEDVIADIKEVAKDKIIISVAAGVTMQNLYDYFGNPTLKVARAMPNTPACVQMGMSSLTFSDTLSANERVMIQDIFNSFGSSVVVDEQQIHAVIGASGSSPAYLFMIMDAMIQNAIKHGLGEAQAKQLVTQSVMGAAKMVATLDESPDQLKINVCSPNGTTIEAVHVLEEKNIYDIMDEAMDACIARSKEMSK